jgi:hypothetical protein
MTASTSESLSFEKVWALFQETDRKFQESDRKLQESDRKFQEWRQAAKEEADRKLQEADRKFQESDRKFQEWWQAAKEEADRSMRELRESMQETDRRMKETDRRIGELGNRFGELAEHLVAPSIKEKFNALGFTFDKCSQNIDIADALDKYSGAEIDILLENGDVAIAIEIKARALTKDVDRHLERMEVLRRWADRHNDQRTFLGAVAGAIMPEEVRKHALKAGFYVIEQTGDTVSINIPPDFKPREW